VLVIPSEKPSRSFSQDGHPPASVTPYVPTVSSSILIESVWPGRAPATSIGPMSACPASS